MTEEKIVHLLLVDDDPHILKLCEWYLTTGKTLGPEAVEVSIHTATSGEAAVALAQALAANDQFIACAMVDMVLPDGWDGIDTICRLWDVQADMQAVLITGAGERVEKEIEGRVAHALLDRWDYLAKPFTEFQFVQRMRRALTSWVALRSALRRASENDRLVAELEATVAERTRALADRNADQERKNQELECALRDLEAAQGKLLQQEKMACIGQLAAGVAHELNNPIGFVHSNLGTLHRYQEKIDCLLHAYEERTSEDEDLAALKRELKMDFVREDLPALINESLEGTERVRKIVSDLKVFSHPAEQEAKFADINEGLRSTLNIVHNEVKYKATVHTDLGELPEVRCFAGQINQVFMNLLVNAAQAIEEHGEIRICTRADGDHVVITVADDGAGIPEEVRSRVFDPFFTTKEVGQGTGLGLSISYDIVRKHGGSLAVKSEPGAGTKFTIRLPVDGGRGCGEPG